MKYDDNGFSFAINYEDNDRETRIRVGEVNLEDGNIAEEKGIWIDTDIYDADAPLLLLSKEVWDALVKYVERRFQ
jgi:hypothetical protein